MVNFDYLSWLGQVRFFRLYEVNLTEVLSLLTENMALRFQGSYQANVFLFFINFKTGSQEKHCTKPKLLISMLQPLFGTSFNLKKLQLSFQKILRPFKALERLNFNWFYVNMSEAACQRKIFQNRPQFSCKNKGDKGFKILWKIYGQPFRIFSKFQIF